MRNSVPQPQSSGCRFSVVRTDLIQRQTKEPRFGGLARTREHTRNANKPQLRVLGSIRVELYWCRSGRERLYVVSQGFYMMSLNSAAEPAFRSETKSPSAVRAPRERKAPIAELSPSKRHALMSCFNAGGLYKKDGAWHGPQGGKPISGMTTADLARDGMLTLKVQHPNSLARLTERGNWFARTLLSDGTPLSRTE